MATTTDKRALEQTASVATVSPPAPIVAHPGLPYNRWLATVLLAMGVPASQWERPGEKGYGNPRNAFPEFYTPAKLADNSTTLPLLT